MIFKHYYCFENGKGSIIKNRLDLENWEKLRNEGEDTSFSIENTVEEYEKNCKDTKIYIEYAKRIIDIFKEIPNGKIISCGCGKGILEWNILDNSDLDITCSDYAEKGLMKLSRVFNKTAEFLPLDILNGDLKKLEMFNSAIMFRISTEFDLKDWKRVFKNFYESKVEYIVFIPTEVADFRLGIHEYGNHVYRKLTRMNDVFCGYLYTKKEFERFWKGMYKVYRKELINGNTIFCLKRI